MSSERDSVGRTLLVAGGVALFCSLFVSIAVYWLRPIQAAYQSMEQNRAIVAATGLFAQGAELSDREVVSAYLELDVRLVDLSTDRFADTDTGVGPAYDYRAAMNDPERTQSIPSDRDTAGIGRRPTAMPVYLRIEAQSLQRIVLPVYGQGMWSTIHGFVGLGPDVATVTGVSFYEHGETPGIGDRIQSDAWLSSWRGKRAYSEDGDLVLRIGSGAGGGARTERVDAITGATVTVTAVDGLIRYWFGEDGYGPFLARLRSEGP